MKDIFRIDTSSSNYPYLSTEAQRIFVPTSLVSKAISETEPVKFSHKLIHSCFLTSPLIFIYRAIGSTFLALNTICGLA